MTPIYYCCRNSIAKPLSRVNNRRNIKGHLKEHYLSWGGTSRRWSATSWRWWAPAAARAPRSSLFYPYPPRETTPSPPGSLKQYKPYPWNSTKHETMPSPPDSLKQYKPYPWNSTKHETTSSPPSSLKRYKTWNHAITSRFTETVQDIAETVQNIKACHHHRVHWNSTIYPWNSIK